MSSCGPHPVPADGSGEPVRVVVVSGADAVLAARLGPLLSDAEHERAARIRATGLRIDFVVARAVLRAELGRELGCDPVDIALRTTSTGKPVLDGGARPELSVTHTDGLLLVAWHPVLPVGIDAERADRALHPALFDRVTAPSERVALAALPASLRSTGLLRLWVRKEAVVKADGRGLALALAGVEVLGGQPLAVAAPAPDPLRVELLARTQAGAASGVGVVGTSVEGTGGRTGGRTGGGTAGRTAGGAAGLSQVGGSSGWVHDLDVGLGYVAAVATIGWQAEVSVRPWAGLPA